MDLQLRGKRVVITGASKGIGLATAEAFAAEGADLVLVARSEGLLRRAQEDLTARFGVDVSVVVADVATASGREAVDQAVDTVDVLVNNAGAIPPGSLLELSEETWRGAWDLKVYGFIFLSQLLYPKLKSSRGVIAQVIGAASEALPASYVAGAVGNSALVAFTKAFAKTARRDDVRVVAVTPSAVATDRYETMMRGNAHAAFGDEERWRELESTLPFGRSIRPEEVADALLFLCSPRSAYTTGAVLVINGAPD